jgi:RNA polymerase sigma-70 factor (ECF subfamily)
MIAQWGARELLGIDGVQQGSSEAIARMNETGDWELVARAQDGDVDAFAELVRRYQGPVMHFCMRMVSSERDAEEIAQDSFIRVYRHLPRLRPRARFSTVLFGIARNLALNFLRDAKRRGDALAQPLDADMATGDSRSRPDRSTRLAQIRAALEDGLGRLSPGHREVLVLREIQGLDYEAIARICRCRLGTVRSRLARAREQLRLHMAALGGEDL